MKQKTLLFIKRFLSIVHVLLISKLYANEKFTVIYNMNNSPAAIIESALSVLTAEDAVFEGNKLQNMGYATDSKNIVWKGEISKSTPRVFENSFIRLDITPKENYKISIKSIKIRHKGVAHPNNFLRIGSSVSTIKAEDSWITHSSENLAFSNEYGWSEFSPKDHLSTASGIDYLSVWIGARVNKPDKFNWFVDEIKIEGIYERIDSEILNIVKVSNNLKQLVRLGVDAERLWHWDDKMKDQLAQLAVGDLRTDYVRVAILAKYEIEKGIKDESAYKEVLELMGAMKNINPNIQFFASPRPLFEAYSRTEREKIWGHKDNTPWSPYPSWILQWSQKGNKKMGDGTTVPKWVEGDLDLDALIQYFADYLNLMHTKGFKISYLDVTNEKGCISPSSNKYIYEKLPKLLNSGVNMPKLIAPSSWDVLQATDWLKTVDISKNEHMAFDVASTHNTGSFGVLEEFANLANSLGKEAWNTELHEWFGIESYDEIMTSEIFWKHMRAGFTGIDTWLFYGPADGRGHTMIWVDKKNQTLQKSTKYEIFKQIVNNANLGNYVDISMPYQAAITTAFVKDNVLTIWILNKSKKSISNTLFDLGSQRSIMDKTCELICWNATAPRIGLGEQIKTQSNNFTYTIEGESLYMFKLKIKN